MKKLFFLLSLVMVSLIYAQDAVLPLGGNVNGNGGSLSYSVGQIATMTGEGVQQAYEIYLLTALDDVKIDCDVYPNPTSDILHVRIEQLKDELMIQLLDIQGRLVEQQTMNATCVDIDMSTLLKGIYFLHVIQQNQTLATYKIIKN